MSAVLTLFSASLIFWCSTPTYNSFWRVDSSWPLRMTILKVFQDFESFSVNFFHSHVLLPNRRCLNIHLPPPPLLLLSVDCASLLVLLCSGWFLTNLLSITRTGTYFFFRAFCFFSNSWASASPDWLRKKDRLLRFPQWSFYLLRPLLTFKWFPAARLLAPARLLTTVLRTRLLAIFNFQDLVS